MKITRSWCSAIGQEKCRLEINAEGESIADALKNVLRLLETAANRDGGEFWEAYRGWRDAVDPTRGIIEAAERQRDEARSQLAEAIAQRDKARTDRAILSDHAVTTINQREDARLDAADARRKALTEAAEMLAVEAHRFGSRMVGWSAKRVREMIDKPAATTWRDPRGAARHPRRYRRTGAAPVSAHDDRDTLSERVAAQGVRDLLDGKLTGPPLPGTLADRVHQALDAAEEDAIWRGFR